MKKSYEIKEDIIILNRELTELDLFVRDFIKVISNYSDYLIVSGYVSISTGRIRGTEDVDILIEVSSEEDFKKIFLALQKNGFWCYQGEDYKEIFRYFKRKENIRFAKNDTIFPNMEVIAVTKERKAKYYEFKHPQKIKISDFEFNIPPLEFEILYKEKVLGSKKDKEDAAHLRTFFSEILNTKRFKEIEEVLKDEI
jgi:hypothetical protein